MRSQQTIKKQKKMKSAVKTTKDRQKKVTAQTQIVTKIAKSQSWQTPTKTLARLKHEKKHEIS